MDMRKIFFFDPGNGDDARSEDGGNSFDFVSGDDTVSKDRGNPSFPSSPSKGTNFSEDELNDGEVISKLFYLLSIL